MFRRYLLRYFKHNMFRMRLGCTNEVLKKSFWGRNEEMAKTNIKCIVFIEMIFAKICSCNSKMSKVWHYFAGSTTEILAS